MRDVGTVAEMDEQVQRYLDHLAVERGLSRHTVDAYRRDLRRYVEFCAARGVRTAGDVDDDAVAAGRAADVAHRSR